MSGANLIVFTLTAFTALLMPIVLDVDQYAYWQLFSLYSSFAGFFVLGFNDGVYLNYSHPDVATQTGILKSFLRVVLILGLTGGAMLLILGQFLPGDKGFAVMATGVCVLFYGSNGFFAYLNQMRMTFGQYAVALVLEKAVFAVAVATLFVVGVDDYRLFVVVAVAAAVLKLIYNVASSQDVVAVRSRSLRSIRPQIAQNFRQGFLLMLSVLMCASVLVPARLVVEKYSGIASFGVFSFALTAVSVITLCVVSVGQIFYPMLRRIDPEARAQVFKVVHEMMTIAAALALCSFLVTEMLVQTIYNQYSDMLGYLAFLFPTCVFQSKYILLILNEQKLSHSMIRACLGGASGMLLNLVFSLAAWHTFHRVDVVAAACLVGYIVWFYPWWLTLLARNGLPVGLRSFTDLGVVSVFLVSAVLVRVLFHNEAWGTALSYGSYLAFAMALGLYGWFVARKRWVALRNDYVRAV